MQNEDVFQYQIRIPSQAINIHFLICTTPPHHIYFYLFLNCKPTPTSIMVLFIFCFIRFKDEHIFRFQLFEQDIGPLKRSLSAKTRRFSRISEIALVTKCFWGKTCCFKYLKKRLKVSLHFIIVFRLVFL